MPKITFYWWLNPFRLRWIFYLTKSRRGKAVCAPSCEDVFQGGHVRERNLAEGAGSFVAGGMGIQRCNSQFLAIWCLALLELSNHREHLALPKCRNVVLALQDKAATIYLF